MYVCHHGEDRILDKLTGGKATGYYVDVGAHSPTHESVTKVFYDRGWHGINIEPQEHYYQSLLQQRPRDTNLPYAIGRTAGSLTLRLGDALTTAVPDYADSSWQTVTVEMRTLTSVLDEHASQPIDFLKIDVEGWELDVIEGMDWTRYRPQVLCVECTQPNTTIPTYAEWDSVLVRHGYVFVTDNTYNRFYKVGE